MLKPKESVCCSYNIFYNIHIFSNPESSFSLVWTERTFLGLVERKTTHTCFLPVNAIPLFGASTGPWGVDCTDAWSRRMWGQWYCHPFRGCREHVAYPLTRFRACGWRQATGRSGRCCDGCPMECQSKHKEMWWGQGGAGKRVKRAWGD